MDVLIRELIDRRKAEFLVLDDQLEILRLSDGATAFGETPESVLVGADVRSSFPELAGSERELRRMVEDGEGEWALRNLSRGTGQTTDRCFDLTVRPHASRELVLIIEDITERAIVERQLLQLSNESRLLLQTVTAARDMLARIINAIDDALFVTSPSGVIRTMNAAASRLFAQHEGELTGASIRDVIDADVVSRLHIPVQHVEVSVKNKRGEELPLSLAISIVRGIDESPEHIVVLARDLRSQKAAEQQISQLRSEKHYLLEEIEAAHRFHGMVGKSGAMENVFKQIEQVAQSDSTVLLHGETGTGKELVARAIHTMSTRNDHLLVKVNCAAFQSSVVESELFGHEKGAFTGAVARRAGRFEFASGGTILLDEIGDLHLETQAKLLRVLQEQEFERVGGNVPVKVNVRVIAATNRNLSTEVEAGRFRSDLFFRINVFPIHLPPLRERREDIPLLVNHFLAQFSSRSNKHVTSVSPKAMNILLAYTWPGNVRELSAVLERAVIISDGSLLKESALSFIRKQQTPKRKGSALVDVEKDHILTMLKSTGGVIEGPKGAAIRLGINPSTLRSRMKKLGIQSRKRPFS